MDQGADMADTIRERTTIIGGVDTHQDLHTAAIVDRDGAVLGCESFSTTRAGYRAKEADHFRQLLEPAIAA